VVLEVHPIPSPRPRFAGKPFPKVYMPAAYTRHKTTLRALLDQAGLTRSLRGPVRLHVVGRVVVPASFPGWKRQLCERGDLWPATNHGAGGGDVDNYLKTIMDAANPEKRKAEPGGLWGDDGCVRNVSMEIMYARPDVQGGRPFWRLIAWNLPGRLASEATTKAGEVIGG
jgi:Holliday junction resolvase RusA-like endonuclease